MLVITLEASCQLKVSIEFTQLQIERTQQTAILSRLRKLSKDVLKGWESNLIINIIIEINFFIRSLFPINSVEIPKSVAICSTMCNSLRTALASRGFLYYEFARILLIAQMLLVLNVNLNCSD